MNAKVSTGLGAPSSTAALAQTAETATPAKPYKPEPVTAERMKEAEHVVIQRVINCDVGTEVDHLKDPSYWTHIAATLCLRAQIRCYGHDETWRADLEVVECGRLFARVKLLHYYDLTDGVSEPVDTAVADEPYYAKNLGAQQGWAVVRRSDQRPMEDGIGTRDQAQLKARQMSVTHTKK